MFTRHLALVAILACANLFGTLAIADPQCSQHLEVRERRVIFVNIHSFDDCASQIGNLLPGIALQLRPGFGAILAELSPDNLALISRHACVEAVTKSGLKTH